MIKTISYWSPHINKVATIKAVYNSAISLNYFSKGRFRSEILDTFGEWKEFNNKDSKDIIKFYRLTKFNFLHKFSSDGFFLSRLKYILIFLISFFPLKKYLENKKPEYLLIHLVTSLPLFLNLIFDFKSKIILRISGKPKMNLLRHIFWKFALKKVYKITFPTYETLNSFKKLKITEDHKLILIYDPIIKTKEIILKKKQLFAEKNLNLKDYYISIGRLTKQKNFIFLINCFREIIKSNPDIKLVIIGEGEQYSKIKEIIKKFKIEKNIFLLGYQKNIFNYLYNSKGFILSSLWEDPGFVIVESIFCNTFVLSSNCSSGPKEIIGTDRGILFENNSKEDFIRKFYQFKNLDTIKKNSYIYNAKKFIKRFTLLSHYNELKKIII